MKLAAMILMVTMGAVGQTAHPIAKQDEPKIGDGIITVRACEREGEKDCVFIIGTTTDAHGCLQWTGFEWDEGSQTCRISVVIQKQPQPVTCSPLSKPDADGTQHMVCYYKPKPEGGK